ncbi:MAG: LysR family transcriptional regulator [Lewinella sp.]|nr:LysR family transcriptional regulator [Lewinella sp.]
MNLQQLEYIIAVDQLKNFSRAAEQNHVTQATLSTMIKKLEEELDLILFDRKTKPILTTECGKEIVAEARKVVHHAHRLKELAKVVQNKIEGRLRIAVIPTIANALIPKLANTLLTKYPQLELAITEQTTETIIEQLKSGVVDVGIAATPLGHDEIEEQILYYEMLMVYGVASAENTYLIPEDIRDRKVWLLEEGHCLREQFINLCSLQKTSDLPHHFNFEANSFDTLLNMVDEFGGLTLIPELFYDMLPAERKQRVGLFKAPIPVREVSLIYHRPYAKFRLMEVLAQEIKVLVQDKLRANQYKKSELIIADIY